MVRRLLLSVILAASSAVAQLFEEAGGQVDTTRIIGGTEAEEGRYSYAVSLGYYDATAGTYLNVCGGSLITRNVVLTAGHCQGSFNRVLVGYHDLVNDSGDLFDVEKEVLHPSYATMNGSEATDNDVMLVFLNGASTADDVVTVKLNSDPSIPFVGESVTVMGWGDMDPLPPISDELLFQEYSSVLMNVDVNVVSNEECEASEGLVYGEILSFANMITESMLCAIDYQKDSCQGDSGGPLVIKGSDAGTDLQVGIVSWGPTLCASDVVPGVYTRVSQVYDWIQSEVCEGSSDYASMAGFDCSSKYVFSFATEVKLSI
jgi:trypsin